MKWTARFDLPRLDVSRYRAQLTEELTRHLTTAAQHWLGATSSLIPVWSGASLATFTPLASLVHFALLGGPNTASASTPNRTSLGLGAGVGDFSADGESGQFTFTYATTLPHLVYNEFNNANLRGFHLRFPGPYRFQEQGLAAFKQFAQTVRISSPLDSLTVTTVKV